MNSNNKRKRGSDGGGLGGPASKQGRKQRSPAGNKETVPAGEAPHGHSHSEAVDEGHVFLVPVGPVPGPSVPARKKDRSSHAAAISRPDHLTTDGELKDKEATAEQLKYTDHCRKFRQLVAKSICDTHHDIRRRNNIEFPDILAGLLMCLTKYPTTYASTPKALEVSVDDLSNEDEIKSFLPIWLHGLSTLIFVEQLKDMRSDIIQLLRDIGQSLAHGNPELIPVCLIELMDVLNDLVSSNEDGNDNSRIVKVNVEFKFPEGIIEEQGTTSKLRVFTKLNHAEFNAAVCDFLDVLRAFAPKVLQVNVLLKHKLLDLITKLWWQLNSENKMKLLMSFVTPILPFILSPENVSLELGSMNLLSAILTMDLEKQNSFLFHRLNPFFSSVKNSGVQMCAQSQSYQLRIRSTILKLIKGEKFRTISPDQQREVIGFSSTIIGGEPRLVEDVVAHDIDVTPTRLVVNKSQSYKEIMTLLEPKIIAELNKTYLQNFETFGETKQSDANVRVIPVFSRQASVCWNNVFGRAENTIESCINTLEGRGTVSELDLDHLQVLENCVCVLEMATNMNVALKKCVEESNINRGAIEPKVVGDFHFFNNNFLLNWTKLSTSYILTGCRTNDIVATEKGLELFINGISLFQNGKFLTPKPSTKLITEWVCILGLTWFHKFKHRIPQKALPSAAFLSEVKPAFLDKISSQTKMACLKALKSNRFIIRKTFIVDIILYEMETSKCAVALLDMVKCYDWTVKFISWHSWVEYVHRVMDSVDWNNDVDVRNALGDAIPSLVCIWTNGKEQATVQDLDGDKRMQLQLDKCDHCRTKKVCSESLCIPLEKVAIIIRLLQPLLESRFIVVKIALSRIISVIRFHSTDFSPELIVLFASTAATGKIPLGVEIMKQFQTFFYTENDMSLSSDSMLRSYRQEGIETFFNALSHITCKFDEDRKCFNYVLKMLTIFQELAPSCDQQLVVELMKCVLRLLLLIRQDSNVVNMIAQSLVTNIALNSKPSCTSWELLTRLRYDLAKTIVDLVCEKLFCPKKPQTERLRSFLGSLVTIGEYRTQNIFIHHYYPALLGHIVPLLHESLKSSFLLDGLSSFASKSTANIFQDGFHVYFRRLMLDYNSEAGKKVFEILKSKYNLDFEFVASNILQTAVNELLCYLQDRKEKVVKSISLLLLQDPVSGIGKNIPRSEIQELLSKHLMGFLVFVDTKMNSRLESVTTKARILKSFTAVMDLMGKVRLNEIRTKIYTTLNSLFGLGPQFHALIFDAWKTYASQLDNSVFGPMSAQILAAVLVMKDTLPSEVDLLIANFVLTKETLTASYYNDLYFILDFTKNEDVKRVISKGVDGSRSNRSGSWTNFVELLVREARQENSHIRLQAIRKLHDTLLKDQDLLSDTILEKEHPLVSNIVKSLLNATRDADYEMLSILGECFGALGAVDPYRFGEVEHEANKAKLCRCFTTDVPEFALKYLDLLIREFQEAEDTTNFDYCACLIQQVLKHFEVESSADNRIWGSLSPTLKKVVEPLLISKYKVEKEILKPAIQGPIFRSEHGRTFEQWLSNWLCIMISHVEESSAPYQLFKSSKYMIPRNSRIASFLLPFVATYAVIGGSEDDKASIVAEIQNILQRWIEQDKLKANSQVFVAVKEVETDEDSSFEQAEKKVIHDDDVFQFRCTQEVFTVYDHLFRAARQATRQIRVWNSTQGRSVRGASAPIQPCLKEEEAQSITNILSRIPLHLISQVAFHCEDYKRALFYIELDLKQTPGLIQDNLKYLQQLYVSLNDLDSVVGVAALRNRDPCMNEIVLESIAKGKKEAAVRNLECMVSADPQDLIASNGLLQAYLSMDEPSKAEILVKGFITKNPEWEIALQEAQMEALWKLRDWKGLQSKLSEDSCNVPITASQGFHEPSVLIPKSLSEYSGNMNILRILSKVEYGSLDCALDLLREMRLKLMSLLVAAASDLSSGYSRTYLTAVQLHILSEIEQATQLMKNTKNSINFNAREQVEVLIKRWNNRLKFVLNSQRSTDPILNVRKSLLSTLRKCVKNDKTSLSLIDGSIRDCWLAVARVQSREGNFTRAQNCLVEAKKFNSPEVLIEETKLLSKRGDKEEAVKILFSGLNSFFPKLDEWRRNNELKDDAPVESSDMRKLCSKALLLYAKLCDEQQLMDYDVNISNYKSATDVYCESEKNFFCLAGYYDRLWGGIDDIRKQAEMKMLVVKYYAQSLHYGSKYVYQSLPRLLSIWFDHATTCGTGSSNGSDSSFGSTHSSSNNVLDRLSPIKQMQSSIRKLMQAVPMYVLLTAFSQIISRVCHGNGDVWDLLKEMIGNIICTHPHQTLWMTMAVSKSSYQMRKSRCVTIFRSVEKKKPELKQMISNYTTLADRLIEVCVKEIEKSLTKVSMERICRKLPKLLASNSFGNVIIPFHMFMNPSLPSKGSGHANHDAFPQKFVFIKAVEDTVDIMHSLVRPKKVCFTGSNGKKYIFLCKAKDDLRKDCKVMEVNSVVNWYLHRNPESRQRQLQVRLYAVTPLNEEHGLLEWVPNLSGIRAAILPLLKEKGILISIKDLRSIIKSTDPLSVKKKIYLEKMVKPHPPVFSEWFLNNFHDPQGWYNARLSYIRTAAVMSIMGFILGLGDRHGENINIDSSTGDIVHVDFNCLFNKGETFDVPERVPFRLTQNMVEGMGPLGYEGVFRRSCEITMGMIREKKQVFLSVLRPFVYDPLVEWDTNGSRSTTGETTNSKAMEHMKHIENRISGSARNMKKETDTELSVEAQVAYLIDEATSVDNLCRMYVGWTPFI